MARERRQRRLHGRYKLRRVRESEIDEEDGNETVIEYTTGTDTDSEEEEEEARQSRDRRRQTSQDTWPKRCWRATRADCWRSSRDIIVLGLIVIWLVSHATQQQKDRLATWQRVWDGTVAPAVRNITTESVASLRRFHNRNPLRGNHSGLF